MPRRTVPSRRPPRERLTVTRLRRPGDDPVRLLVVAETGSVDPSPEAPAPLLLDALDRLWLRLRRGLEIDVLHEPAAALDALARTSSAGTARGHDLVVVLLADPAVADRVGDRLGRLLDEGPELPGTTAPAVLVLPPGAPGPRPAAGPEHRSDSARSSLVVSRAEPRRPGAADALARQLQELLEAHGPAPRSEGVADPSLPPGLERRLAQITRIARDAFGTDTAAINLAAGDRLHTLVAAGGERGSQPLAGSLCDLTVQRGGLVVITDTLAVPALQPYRALHAPEPVRFYAGHPVTDSSGAVRGALCVYDRSPHDRDEFDFTLLGDLALLAEGELAHPASDPPLPRRTPRSALR